MNTGIFFVEQDTGLINSNSLCVDFLKRTIRLPQGEIVPFEELLKGNAERIADQVSIFLSQLNEKNYSLSWWSYIFTSKNPLSSPLFNELIDIILVLETIHNFSRYPFSVYVVNARYSQKMVILRFFNTKPFQIAISIIKYKWYYLIRKLYGFLRAIFLIFTTVFANRRVMQKVDKQLNKIGIFTYIDGSTRGNQDPFFGELINQLKGVEKTFVNYIFYLYRPIKNRLSDLKSEKNSFVLLLCYLNWKDIFWAIIAVAKEFFAFYNDQLVYIKKRNVSLYPLIREYMIFEFGRGYTDNLLVFRAARNMALSGNFKTIIYPFENKSLEKSLLLGLNSLVKTIGYQHSSITPRHFTFKLQGNEPNITPMPDKIITVGEVTQQWLIKTGNFPENKIQVGFSLRHNLDTKFEKKSFEAKKAKLLFAFSSGYSEISKVITFLKPIVEQQSEIIIRFRNHINFPFNQLDQSDKNWIDLHVEKVPRNILLKDIEWADVVVYISSSVVLEALFCGVPAIWLNIDILNSDPLLIKHIPYRWECLRSNDFFVKLQEIANLNDLERLDFQKMSSVYVNRYLKKERLDNYKLFLS
jgi:hypothetical protein